jgi:hypothetical protein
VLASRASTRLGLFSVLALVALWPVSGRAGSFNEFRDAQFLYAYEDAAVQTVREFGQLPLWNPYYCGGMYALGAPQARFASPAFLVSLLLGAGRAQVVIAFIMLVLGMEGCFRYLRERTASALGAALAAPVLGLNGFYATAYFNGWILIYGFALLPWILFGVLRTLRRDPWGLVLVSVGSAWMIGFGLHYAPLFALLYGFFEVLWAVGARLGKSQRLAERLGWLGVAGLFALGLSAFRLWPVAETMIHMPRIMAGAPGNSWTALGHALFARANPRFGNLALPGEFFFGLWPLPLVLLGLGRRRLWPAAVLAGVSVWSATGYAYSAGPYAWIRELPGFAFTRYPERFLWLACFYASLLVAGGIHGLVLVSRGRAWARPLVALAAIALALGYRDAVRNQHAALRGMQFSAPPPFHAQPFAQARGNRWLAGYYPPLARGSLSCLEGYAVAQSERLRGDLPQEEYLEDPSAGELRRTFWSPNRIELEAELVRGARVLVNQNWHAGWRASVGTVQAEEGLLAVDLPAGNHRLTLRFLPRSALGGVAVALTALVGLGLLVRRRKSRSRLFAQSELWWTLAGALGPLALGVLLRLAIPEASTPKPLLRNANGKPLLVDALPAQVNPLAVEFELPVRLEGVSFPQQLGAWGIGDFELYWRVTGSVPRAVGVFVHLEGPGGARLPADHEVIGASVFFQNAPRERRLRDAFSVDLSRAPRGKWSVYVGLWYASGDGGRVGIRAAPNTIAAEGRVLTGTFELR